MKKTAIRHKWFCHTQVKIWWKNCIDSFFLFCCCIQQLIGSSCCNQTSRRPTLWMQGICTGRLVGGNLSPNNHNHWLIAILLRQNGEANNFCLMYRWRQAGNMWQSLWIRAQLLCNESLSIRSLKRLLSGYSAYIKAWILGILNQPISFNYITI